MKNENPCNHDAIVAEWKANAEPHDDENFEFVRGFKHRNYGFAPDTVAGELHREVFEIIDCTRCANCCKEASLEFEDPDIDRIAGHFDMPTETFIEKYLEFDEMEDSYWLRQKPCPFLADDRCSIYDIRPTVCREYPHTDKKGFTSRTYGVANNCLICPAVFWIVERMKEQASR